MPADIGSETEKQVRWIEKLGDWVYRQFSTVFRWGIRSGVRKISEADLNTPGFSKNDQYQTTNLNAEDSIKFGRQMNDDFGKIGKTHRFVFNTKDGGQITSDNKRLFKEINDDFQSVLDANSHINIVTKQMKELKNKVADREDIILRSAKGLGVDKAEKIMNLTSSSIDSPEIQGDQTLKNFIDSMNVKQYLLDKKN